MRTLIGAACIAVIAFVGYYFWGEWSRTQAESVEQAAFEDECYRTLGIVIDNPFAKGVADSFDECNTRLQEGWVNKSDARIEALKAEGAARIAGTSR